MLENKNHMHIHDTVRLSAFRLMPQKWQQKRVKILIVNGNGRGGKLLKDILISGGYEVEALSDGSEGLELCKKNNFTLVFTDLEISGLSAWQLGEEIKKINKDVPVILITGWKAQPDESALKKSQIDFVVNKPFSFNQVLKLVKELTNEV
jgi:two-component system response regulator PilR (NtrC family)